MLTVIIAIWIASMAWMVYEALTAEEGWEDEEGYHKGRREDEAKRD